MGNISYHTTYTVSFIQGRVQSTGVHMGHFSGKQFQKIKIGKFMPSRNKPDNVVFLNDNTVLEIVIIVEDAFQLLMLFSITWC